MAMGTEGVAATCTIVQWLSPSCSFPSSTYKYFAHRLALYQVLAALLYGVSLTMEPVNPDPSQEMNSACWMQS